MLSAEKIAANRENATHSTGPVTETGKKISSQNRTSHGLTARRVVLQNEDQTEFDEMHAALFSDYAPQSQVEEELVQEIADASWRLRRVARLETELFDSGENFIELSSSLDKLRRYRTSIERAFHKAIDQLRKIQGTRPPDKKAMEQKCTQTALGKMLDYMMNAPLPGEGGFVSQQDPDEAGDREEIMEQRSIESREERP